MTPRYTSAIHFAAKVHEGQFRKGTAIPYITHPVAVAGLVAYYGGDEDQQIAALLHDVLEDGGPQFAADIERQFGTRVLAIVQGCTDGMPDASGQKTPWEERKKAYIAHLTEANGDLALVSGCDKLSNARAILDDLIAIGPAVFERFTAKREGTIWYYQALSKVFETLQAPMSKELSQTIERIARIDSENAVR